MEELIYELLNYLTSLQLDILKTNTHEDRLKLTNEMNEFQLSIEDRLEELEDDIETKVSLYIPFKK